MSSQAQIQANRQNAQRSTGPNTEEGKQKSGKNAVKHGFLARILPAESADYQELIRGLYESFKPADEFQRTLVDQIALATIRLRRIYQAEIDLVDIPRKKCTSERSFSRGDVNVKTYTEWDAPYPIGEFLKGDMMRNMIRYEVMCQRQIQRNVKLLESLKSFRWSEIREERCPYLGGAESNRNETESPEPELDAQADGARSEIDDDPACAESRPNEPAKIGFVSQNHAESTLDMLDPPDPSHSAYPAPKHKRRFRSSYAQTTRSQ